jgi:hypothetical protein
MRIVEGFIKGAWRPRGNQAGVVRLHDRGPGTPSPA